jgi:hypothetical protein
MNTDQNLTEKHQNQKSHGIFYSPDYITKYMVESILLKALSKNTEKIESIGQLIQEYQQNISELILKIHQLHIIDPSCGAGAFLIQCIDFLNGIYKKIHDICEKTGDITWAISNLDESNLKQKIIEENIFGVDIMPNAVELAKKAILSNIESIEKDIPEIHTHFKIGDALVDDFFNWSENFPSIFGENSPQGFNVVIGNPPWGGTLKTPINQPDYYQTHYQTIEKSFDSFSLFIERVFTTILTQGGYFSFIIPNEICSNSCFTQLRKLLLEQSQLLEIVNLGENIFEEVTRPCLIFSLKREIIPQDAIQTTLVKIRKGYSEEEKDRLKSNQISLLELIPSSSNSIEFYSRTYLSFLMNESFRWDIHRNELDKQILEQILTNPQITPVSQMLFNGRGFEFNKRGYYLVCGQCGMGNPYYGRGNSSSDSGKRSKICWNSNCGNIMSKKGIEGMNERDPNVSITGYLKKAFVSTPRNKSDKPVLVGEDIQLLSIKAPSRFINPQNKELALFNLKLNTADHLYRGERIFVRKIGSPLIGTVSDIDAMCNDQCYIWKLKPNFAHYSHYYILAIFLSRFLFYYYELQIGNEEKEVFPHFRQEDIKKFPIPQIDFKNEKQRDIYYAIIADIQQLQQLMNEFKQLITSENDKSQKKDIIESMQNRKTEIKDQIIKLDNDMNDKINLLYSIDSTFINQRIIKLGYLSPFLENVL